MGIPANWSRENIAWAAGLFEGEGCIYPPTNILSLMMTDKDVVERFFSVVGCGTVALVTAPSREKHWKPAWRWVCTKQEHAQAILAAFWPWLGARRKSKAEEYIKRMGAAHLNVPRRGASNGMAKLSADDVLEILTGNESGVSLAKRFGVTETNISSIRTRKSWRHINVPGHVHQPEGGG